MRPFALAFVVLLWLAQAAISQVVIGGGGSATFVACTAGTYFDGTFTQVGTPPVLTSHCSPFPAVSTGGVQTITAQPGCITIGGTAANPVLITTESEKTLAAPVALTSADTCTKKIYACPADCVQALPALPNASFPMGWGFEFAVKGPGRLSFSGATVWGLPKFLSPGDSGNISVDDTLAAFGPSAGVGKNAYQ